MEMYVIVNTTISLAILALLKHGNGTNIIHYYLSFFGVLIWFIPYSLIAKIVPVEVLVEPIILNQSVTHYADYLPSTNYSYFDNETLIQFVALSFVLVGITFFIKQVFKAAVFNKKVLNDSSLQYHKQLSDEYQIPVYSANNVPSGMLLGFRTPKVVFSNLITESKQIKLILCHEKKHFERSDNYRLVFLAFVECLFWWNPLVRALVNKNRFYIEALCDESASQEFGFNEYAKQLASLILFKSEANQLTLTSTATSNKRNNMSRIKLLKENRKMTLKKKVTYVLTLCTALLTMAWHTLVIATDNSSEALAPEHQGTLVTFDLKVKDRSNKDEESVFASQMSMWVDFDKKASFKIGDKFKFNFKVSDLGKDSGSLELAAFDMEIIEISGSGEKVVSNPRLKTAFTQEAMIEIDNFQVSPHAYAIKFTPERALRPE